MIADQTKYKSRHSIWLYELFLNHNYKKIVLSHATWHVHAITVAIQSDGMVIDWKQAAKWHQVQL